MNKPIADMTITVRVLDPNDNEIFRSESVVLNIPKGNMIVDCKPDPYGPLNRHGLL